MVSFWNRFGPVLGLFWDRFGFVLGSFGDRFGIILGSFWDRFGIVLGSEEEENLVAAAPDFDDPEASMAEEISNHDEIQQGADLSD